jgi:hypothetical protein
MPAVRIMSKPYHLVGTKDGQETARLTVFPARHYGEAENITKIGDTPVDHMFTVVDAGNSSFAKDSKIKLTHPSGQFPYAEIDGVRYDVALIPGVRAPKPRTGIVKVQGEKKKRGRPAKNTEATATTDSAPAAAQA